MTQKSSQTQCPPNFKYTESDHITDFNKLTLLSMLTGAKTLEFSSFPTRISEQPLRSRASQICRISSESSPSPGPPTSPTAGELGSSFCSAVLLFLLSLVGYVLSLFTPWFLPLGAMHFCSRHTLYYSRPHTRKVTVVREPTASQSQC